MHVLLTDIFQKKTRRLVYLVQWALLGDNSWGRFRDHEMQIVHELWCPRYR